MWKNIPKLVTSCNLKVREVKLSKLELFRFHVLYFSSNNIKKSKYNVGTAKNTNLDGVFRMISVFFL